MVPMFDKDTMLCQQLKSTVFYHESRQLPSFLGCHVNDKLKWFNRMFAKQRTTGHRI